MADYISHRTVKKRKPAPCIWCGETITKGETALVVVSTEDGEIGSCNWHPECEEACQRMNQREKSWGEPFDPYEFARGTYLCKHDHRVMQQNQPKGSDNE